MWLALRLSFNWRSRAFFKLYYDTTAAADTTIFTTTITITAITTITIMSVNKKLKCDA